MSATIWSKFFWSDWQSDSALRACTLAARGLWMEMLCIAVERGGYLAIGTEPLDAKTLANMVGQPQARVEQLTAELERHGVFSRDRRGRIYSRRMVRDLKRLAAAQKVGKRGGNPTLCKTKTKSQTLKGTDNGTDKPPVAPISQKPESKSQNPEARYPISSSSAAADGAAAKAASPNATLYDRVVEVMGTRMDALYRKIRWMTFADTFQTWVEEGCDPEQDIWPAIRARTANLGRVPNTPAYFTDAIRDARDRRLAVAQAPREAPPSPANPTGWVSPEERESRLEHWRKHGLWNAYWGPEPDEPPGNEPVDP